MTKNKLMLPQEWEAFITDIYCEMFKSSLDVLTYGLVRYKRWLDAHGLDWRGVTPEQAQQWCQVMLACLARSTVNLRLWPVRRFYKWALHARLVKDNPFAFVTLPINRERPKQPFVPSEDEVECLLAKPDTSTFIGIRDRAILELLYASGLRASELLSLSVFSIEQHKKEQVIRVTGKSRNEHVVRYGDEAQHWLARYLHEARPSLLERAGVQQQR